ncbi:MAG: IPT/TIG domain-containing protein [Anaerolinea sp.]|nr:IPT/TIG domain-containing protein [Anaerolinea sp.]
MVNVNSFPRHKWILLIGLLALAVSIFSQAPATAQEPTVTPTVTSSATPTMTPVVIFEQLAITAVQPNTVANAASAELIITGSGFVDGAIVLLSGVGGLNTTFVSSSLLRAVAPAGSAPGVYSLTVVNPNAAAVTLANALTVTGPADPTRTPDPTQTPAPTAFVRPLLVVSSYGASSAEITPGENLDFEMTLTNAGQVQARNVVATFISGSFIARDTGGVRALGSIDPGQSNRFWQPLNASRDLAGQSIGTLQVKVDYTDANGTSYSETFALTFPIVRVSSGPAPTATPTPTPTFTPTPTATPTTGPALRPQLIVTGYETDVAQLQPGQFFTLNLTVQNQGNAAARRVTMILGGGSAGGGTISGTPVSGGGVSGAGGEFSKFAPVGSSNVLSLGDLAQGNALNTSMALIVNGTTEPGAYPIKVSFVYNDAANADYVDDQVITLLVVRRPSVEMTFYAPPPPFFAGEPGSLPLQLVNSGSKSVVFGQFAVTAVDPSGGAFFENSSVFVGNLEPGGFFPLDALIFPAAPGPLELLLSVNYTDDFNQPQTVTKTVTIEIQEPFIFEEPEGGFPGGDGGFEPEPEVEPETFWDKAWRFLKGLLGLSSGKPQPAQPAFAPGLNEPFPGEFPGEGPVFIP